MLISQEHFKMHYEQFHLVEWTDELTKWHFFVTGVDWNCKKLWKALIVEKIVDNIWERGGFLILKLQLQVHFRL